MLYRPNLVLRFCSLELLLYAAEATLAAPDGFGAMLCDGAQAGGVTCFRFDDDTVYCVTCSHGRRVSQFCLLLCFVFSPVRSPASNRTPFLIRFLRLSRFSSSSSPVVLSDSESPCARLEAVFGGILYTLRLLFTFEVLDLAILGFEGQTKPPAHIRLRPEFSSFTGQAVLLWSFPLAVHGDTSSPVNPDHEPTVTAGIVTSIDESIFRVADVTSMPNSSGGAVVVRRDGGSQAIVGVLVGRARSGPEDDVTNTNPADRPTLPRHLYRHREWNKPASSPDSPTSPQKKPQDKKEKTSPPSCRSLQRLAIEVKEDNASLACFLPMSIISQAFLKCELTKVSAPALPSKLSAKKRCL